MIQVRQHDIIAALHQFVIKHDRSDFAGVWMRQPFGAQGPTAIERRQAKRFAIRQTVNVGALERRLGGQLQGHLNHRLNILRRQV